MARSTFGNIRQRTKGVWQLTYRVAGKRKYETVRGSRKDAEARLAELQVQFSDIPLSSSEMTVSVFWNAICRDALLKRVQATTFEGYQSDYKNHVFPKLGDVPINQVTYKQIQSILSGISFGAARSTKRTLSVIWTEAEKHDLIGENIMRKKYVLPKRHEAQKVAINDKIYTLEELNEIFTRCRGEVWEAAFIMSAFGGMRREEAVAFKVGEIDHDGQAAYCHISRVAVRTNSETLIKNEAKTEASIRTVTIIEPYASRLMQIQAEARLQGFVWLLDDGFGELINPDRVSDYYRRWLRDNKMKYIPWKNLRNSYATALHEQGVDLSMIAKMLGHKTPMVTYKHYDKPKLDSFIHAQQKLSGSLTLSDANESKNGKIISFQNRKQAAR